jgi:hypothetical protein
MQPERWKQVDDVLQSALDRAPYQRDAFLQQACAGISSIFGKTPTPPPDPQGSQATRPSGYSYFSATIGSICMARRAGM